MERLRQFVRTVFSWGSIHGTAAKQRETCRESVQRKASENLQCSRMSKPANETLDIFVQQATLNEAWKSNMDMHLVKGADQKRKKQPHSFKLWYWKRNNKWASSGLKTKLSIFGNCEQNWGMTCHFLISWSFKTEEIFVSSILTSWITQAIAFLSFITYVTFSGTVKSMKFLVTWKQVLLINCVIELHCNAKGQKDYFCPQGNKQFYSTGRRQGQQLSS